MSENVLSKVVFMYSNVQILYSIDLEFEIVYSLARDFYLF